VERISSSKADHQESATEGHWHVKSKLNHGIVTMIGKRRKWFRPRVFLSLLVCLFVVSWFVCLFGRLRVCVFVRSFVRSFVGDFGVVV